MALNSLRRGITEIRSLDFTVPNTYVLHIYTLSGRVDYYKQYIFLDKKNI